MQPKLEQSVKDISSQSESKVRQEMQQSMNKFK